MVLMRTTPSRNGRTGFGLLWLSVLVIALDQLTKWYFVNRLDLHERVTVIPNLFDWTLAYNKGVAFSMFNQGLAWQRYGLAFFALTVAIIFAVWMSRLPRHEPKRRQVSGRRTTKRRCSRTHLPQSSPRATATRYSRLATSSSSRRRTR